MPVYTANSRVCGRNVKRKWAYRVHRPHPCGSNFFGEISICARGCAENASASASACACDQCGVGQKFLPKDPTKKKWISLYTCVCWWVVCECSCQCRSQRDANASSEHSLALKHVSERRKWNKNVSEFGLMAVNHDDFHLCSSGNGGRWRALWKCVGRLNIVQECVVRSG